MVYVVQPTTRILFSIVRGDSAVQDYIAAMREHHPETAQHSERVALYSLDMYISRYVTRGQGIAILDTAKIEQAKKWCKAGLYHDAGKLVVPREIIAKGSKLDQKERVEISKHPKYGLYVLREFTKEEEDFHAAVGHHEYKTEGSYPRRQRRGEDEIVEAVALADFYDALASRRAYKPALPKDEVRRIMQADFNGNRKHLDDLLKRAA